MCLLYKKSARISARKKNSRKNFPLSIWRRSGPIEATNDMDTLEEWSDENGEIDLDSCILYQGRKYDIHLYTRLITKASWLFHTTKWK